MGPRGKKASDQVVEGDVLSISIHTDDLNHDVRRTVQNRTDTTAICNTYPAL